MFKRTHILAAVMIGVAALGVLAGCQSTPEETRKSVSEFTSALLGATGDMKAAAADIKAGAQATAAAAKAAAEKTPTPELVSAAATVEKGAAKTTAAVDQVTGNIEKGEKIVIEVATAATQPGATAPGIASAGIGAAVQAGVIPMEYAGWATLAAGVLALVDRHRQRRKADKALDAIQAGVASGHITVNRGAAQAADAVVDYGRQGDRLVDILSGAERKDLPTH